MRKLTSILLAVLAFVASSCYTVKLNYQPDDSIPIFWESPLIQYSISQKRMSYNLSFMKTKGERFQLLRKLEKLNRLAEKKYKAKSITTEKYTGLCTLSTLTLKLVTWFAIFESSQGSQVGTTLKKEDLQTIQTMTASHPQLTGTLSSTKLDTEEDLIAFLKGIIAIMEKELQ